MQSARVDAPVGALRRTLSACAFGFVMLAGCSTSLYPYGEAQPASCVNDVCLELTNTTGQRVGHHDFGMHPIGDVASTTLRLENVGDAAAELEQPVLTGDPNFAVGAYDCPDTLAPDTACALELTYSPDLTLEASGGVLIPYGRAGQRSAVGLTLSGRTDVASLPREQTLAVQAASDEGSFYALGGVWDPWTFAPLHGGAAGAGAFAGQWRWAFLRFVVETAIPPGAIIATDTNASLWLPDTQPWLATESVVLAFERTPSEAPTQFWDHPDNLVGRSLVADPGFETTTGDWGSANVSLTTTEPIAGAASLSVSVSPYNQATLAVPVPEGSFVAPTALTLSVDVRAQVNTANAHVCAAAEYAATPWPQRCVVLPSVAGDTVTLQVSVPLEPTRQPEALVVHFKAEEAPLQAVIDTLDLRVLGDAGRRLTSSAVVWGPSFAPVEGAWNSTPSLQATLQDLVNTAGGLAPGDGIVLWLRGASRDNDYRLRVGAWATNPAQAARLHVHWRLPEE